MMKTPKLVIFDCDGVLVDSVMAHSEVMSENFARYGLHMSPIEVRDVLGAGKMSEIGEAAKKLGAHLPEHWLDEIYTEIFDRLRQGVELIPHIKDVVGKVVTANIPICVASNGSVEKMKIMLGSRGILDYFNDAVFSAHDVKSWKPEPGLFLHAMDIMNVNATDCIVIEDSPTGADAAKRAGIGCLGYAAETNPSELSAFGAHIFDDMRDVPKLIGIE
ncbi:MAG: HAD family phosphatase [Lentilitoribacter sp.]